MEGGSVPIIIGDFGWGSGMGILMKKQDDYFLQQRLALLDGAELKEYLGIQVFPVTRSPKDARNWWKNQKYSSALNYLY
jgi:hypothetical protein